MINQYPNQFRAMSAEEQNQQQRLAQRAGSMDPITAQQLGLVWQPRPMGGGEWISPQVVRLSDEDVNRIAHAVVRLLRDESR